MAFEYLKVFTGRRFVLGYISPAVCEGDFSSTGTPSISLLPIIGPNSPSGPVMEAHGLGFRFSWGTVAGALCYSVYRAVDSLDPFGPYTLVAECITDTFFDIDDAGVYVVEAVTPDGVTPRTEPLHTPIGGGGGSDPTIFVINMTAPSGLGDDGLVAGYKISGVQRPWWYINQVAKDIRGTTTSAPITATQAATTVTASDTFFSAGQVGSFIRFTSGGVPRQITSFTSPMQVEVAVSETVAASTLVVYGATLGGDTGIAMVCNGHGQMAGWEQADDNGPYHAFWYDVALNQIRDLGADTTPRAVNAAGKVLIDVLHFGTTHESWIYNPADDSYDQLTSLDGQVTPFDFNDSDTVVGQYDAHHPNTTTWPKAFRAVGGTMVDIAPPEAGAGNAGQSSQAKFVNAAGKCAGTYIDSADFKTRVFYNDGGASFGIGTALDSDVRGINSSGVICGNYKVSGVFRAFSYSVGGGFLDLGAFSARGINNLGWIVGYDGLSSTAYIYKDGVLHNLNDFLPLASGWTLSQALFVNNNRQIVGLGNNGYFILTIP